MQPLRIYDELTAARTRFLRVDELCRLAAEKGFLPSKKDLEAEARLPLKEKKGLEKAQGLIFTETFYWDLNPQTREWTKRFLAASASPDPVLVADPMLALEAPANNWA